MASTEQTRTATAVQIMAVVFPFLSGFLTTHAALGQIRQARDWAVLLALIGVAAAALSVRRRVAHIGAVLLAVNLVTALWSAWRDSGPLTF